MKHIITIILIVLFFQANAQTNKSRSILDYYLLLPSTYFMCDATTEKDNKETRTRAIKTLDLKNGYILAEPMKFYELQVALFKDSKTKKDLIAVIINCGPGCMCNAKDFLNFEQKDTTWIENQQVLPEKVDGAFILPQYGTIIKVYDFDTFETKISGTITGEKNKLIHELKWVDGKFIEIKK